VNQRSAQDWDDAAKERTQDTETLLQHRPNSMGTIYLAGYVVELNLKALWVELGKQPPRTHDLRSLWLGAGFRLADLQDRTGTRSFFIEDWNTSLRYEATQRPKFTSAELVAAAKKLAQQVAMRRRRNLQRRPR
jgi:HEPN domain-containing protein